MNIIKSVADYTVHGVRVTYARIRGVDDEQGIVICDLLDEGDQVLAADRYFFQDKAPFVIDSADRAALGVPALPGLPSSSEGSAQDDPDDSWRKSDIQAWLESQAIPYSKKDSKAELLEIIKCRGRNDR